jgi:prevent-host-death family protein
MAVVTNISDAKASLSQLVERAEQGETIILGRNGRPVAMLVPYVATGQPRTPGGWEGQVWMAPDFDELPPELKAAFEIK